MFFIGTEKTRLFYWTWTWGATSTELSGVKLKKHRKVLCSRQQWQQCSGR